MCFLWWEEAPMPPHTQRGGGACGFYSRTLLLQLPSTRSFAGRLWWVRCNETVLYTVWSISALNWLCAPDEAFHNLLIHYTISLSGNQLVIKLYQQRFVFFIFFCLVRQLFMHRSPHNCSHCKSFDTSNLGILEKWNTYDVWQIFPW